MARSDQDLSARLRHRLVETVRPVAVTAPRPGRPPTATPAVPRHARPPTDGVDQTALRTLIRPPVARRPDEPGWPDPSGDDPLHAGAEPDSAVPDSAVPDSAGPGPLGRRPSRSPLAFDRRHLVAVVVVLSVALLAGGWALLRARDRAVGAEPVRVTAPAPSTSASGPPSATGTGPSAGPAASATTMMIHVTGAVHDPGLVELPAGARVADAIEAAGGMSDDAVPGRLNLARRLHDGEQVFVSDTEQHPSEVVAAGSGGAGDDGPASTDGSTAPVDLNTATRAELETLPGVGPATAEAILAWRREHGRFSRIEELQEVDGIGPKTFARLAPLVTV